MKQLTMTSVHTCCIYILYLAGAWKAPSSRRTHSLSGRMELCFERLTVRNNRLVGKLVWVHNDAKGNARTNTKGREGDRTCAVVLSSRPFVFVLYSAVYIIMSLTVRCVPHLSIVARLYARRRADAFVFATRGRYRNLLSVHADCT